MALAEAFSASRWEQDVLGARLPVAVLFHAGWCVPCRTVLPYFERAASQAEGRVLLGTLDVDAHREIAERYAVQGLPTLIVLKDGREVLRRVGLIPEEKLSSVLDGVG